MSALREAAQQALELLGTWQKPPARLYRVMDSLRAALAQEQAEPVQEPVAVVGTQVDVWRGCDGRWAPPGEPIKTALMLTDAPVGTMLYATPPKRQPLSGLEVERLLEQVIGSLPAARNLVRAVERAHGIIEPRIEEDSHQTIDEAMQQPRAMEQAYENGYKAGAAAEREAIIQAIPGGHIVDPQWVCDMIRARGNT